MNAGKVCHFLITGTLAVKLADYTFPDDCFGCCVGTEYPIFKTKSGKHMILPTVADLFVNVAKNKLLDMAGFGQCCWVLCFFRKSCSA